MSAAWKVVVLNVSFDQLQVLFAEYLFNKSVQSQVEAIVIEKIFCLGQLIDSSVATHLEKITHFERNAQSALILGPI